jgi:hypothetical protein
VHIVRVRFAFGGFAVFFAAVLTGSIGPALAQDATLAPADEYFGRFNLSVLAIANSIRDCGARLADGGDARALVSGPLAFATDAIHAWEAQYPKDPWIAKDLLALETVYVKMPTDDAARLASATEAWLLADFPASPEAAKGRALLDGSVAGAPVPSGPSNAWERFAALRVPLPPAR